MKKRNREFDIGVIATELILLSNRMQKIGEKMVFVGGFNPEITEHGKELIGAARIARSWASGMIEDT